MYKWLFLAVPFLSGCAWLGARGRDLGDIVRVEGSIGFGLQANVTATEILHLGVGSSQRSAGGWAYGHATSEERYEDHLPLSLVVSFVEPDRSALHALRIGAGKEDLRHRCPIVAPVTFEQGNVRKPSMQFWNLEAGFFALVAGAELGLNPAELADFLLGCFGLDIGGDDDREDRERRRLWNAPSPGRPER